jgi:hypothetical protein
MFWAPCVRIDLPIDAPSGETRELAAMLEPLVATMEETEVIHLNVAFSAAALRAFDRHGLSGLINRIARLAAARRVELLSTAAHGALLPLLPTQEATRQIELNDVVNRLYFGDDYHPACLWPPALAISTKVVDLAARRGLSSILVDESAMRVWPARWPGNRLDSVESMPGVFLVPSTRAASRAFATGLIHSKADLDALAPHMAPGRKSYLVTTANLTARAAPDPALLKAMQTERTLRIEQLFNHFPLSEAVSPLPGSELSQPEELGCGLPFAPWFSPGNERHAVQWRLMTTLAGMIASLEERGLRAEPSVQQLRTTIDLGWRAEWWRDPSLFEPALSQLGEAVDDIRLLLPIPKFDELTSLVRAAEWSEEAPHTRASAVAPSAGQSPSDEHA